MKEDLFRRLKEVRDELNKPYVKKFTSANGRIGLKCYNSLMGQFEIHICQTREDVEASNKRKKRSEPPIESQNHKVALSKKRQTKF